MKTENKNLKDNINNQQYENLNINNKSIIKNELEVKNNELQIQSKIFKKPLTPYQQYKQNKNKNGGKYFEFYDDIKVYTHNIYDW